MGVKCDCEVRRGKKVIDKIIKLFAYKTGFLFGVKVKLLVNCEYLVINLNFSKSGKSRVRADNH